MRLIKIITVCTFFTLLFQVHVYGQHQSNLNKIEGFSSFKLGSSLAHNLNLGIELKKSPDNFGIDTQGGIKKVYQADDINARLGPVDIQEITLIFLNERLEKIILRFEEDEWGVFLDFLKDNFGKSNSEAEIIQPRTNFYQGHTGSWSWEGEKVAIEYNRYMSASYGMGDFKYQYSKLAIANPSFDQILNELKKSKNQNSFDDFNAAPIVSNTNCEAEDVKRDGGMVKVYPVKQIASDGQYDVAVGIVETESKKYISLNIGFSNSSNIFKLTNEIGVRLENQQLITLEIVNSINSRIGNRDLAQAIYSLELRERAKLKNSKMYTISFFDNNEVTHTHKVENNSDILMEQLNCL